MRKSVPVDSKKDGAVEIVRHGSSSAVFITCEHASAEFPEPWALSEEDSWLAGTHWTYDIGAADLARELSATFATVGVLARFSRLLADPNRPPSPEETFRRNAEGRAIALNQVIDAPDRQKRLALWQRYHDALDREVARSPARVLLAVHTFTPRYEGAVREMEIGVLFDEEGALAEQLASELASVGFRVAMNAPYSGKDGLMYSVDRHAKRHGRRALELEVRQDLAVVAEVRARVAEASQRTFLRPPAS